MKHPTRNERGTTLVELIVCMALLGIFSVAVVALIQPCALAFTQMQRQTRAQNLADTVIEELRGEVLQATGQIRFAEAGENVFALSGKNTSGSALEVYLQSGHLLLIDAGAMPRTRLTAVKEENGGAKYAEARDAGTVHLRYFSGVPETPSDAAAYNYATRPAHTDTEAGSPEKAFNYTEAYPEHAYMDMKVDLQFTLRSYTVDTDQITKVSAVTVQVTVTEADGTVVCTQKGILTLPHEPTLVMKK